MNDNRVGNDSRARGEDGVESARSPTVDALLGLRLRDIRLPPDLLALFNARISKSRRKMIAAWCLWCASFNLACLPLDCLIIPAPVWPLDIANRIVLVLTLALIGIGLRRHWLDPREGGIIALPCIVAVVAAGVVGLHTTPALLERYLVNAIFFVGTGLSLPQLSTWRAAAIAGITVGLLSLFVAVSPIAPACAKLQIVSFYAFALFALVEARRIHNVFQIRIFLLGLRDEIKSREVSELNDRLTILANTDPLTRIPNRHCLDAHLARLRAEPAGALPLSLCIIDVDHFKALNDRLGHVEGDLHLRAVATAIRDNLRINGDFLGRYGGDEFVVVLARTGRAEAAGVAERIRGAIASLALPHPDNKTGMVTVSIGVATSEDGGLGTENLMRAADRALYRAKAAGRGRICLDETIPPRDVLEREEVAATRSRHGLASRFAGLEQSEFGERAAQGLG